MSELDDGYGSILNNRNNISSTNQKDNRRPALTRRRSSLDVYRTFLGDFSRSRGAWLIILLGFLASLGFGSLIGVVPQIMTQRYAENKFGYSPEDSLCTSFSTNDLARPVACVEGAEYAQSAASYGALVRNALALLSNSVAGAYSDRHGRRNIQIFLLFLLSLPPLALFFVQSFRSIDPTLYFAIDALTGVINMLSIAFTQLSDSVPPRDRAAAYGLYFGSMMGGIAVAPFLATVLSHVQVTYFSVCMRILALIIAVAFLPETLLSKIHDNIQPSEAKSYDQNYNDIVDDEDQSLVALMLLPVSEMKILLRNKSIMLVAAGAFLGKMVFSADVTLFFFYVESNLGVTNQDVAGLMFATGIVGVVVQAGLLKYLITLIGEHALLVVSFCGGVLHNLIYGLASNIWVLYVGMCLSALTNVNGPLLSAIASRNVADTEQGRIQGALFALTSSAEAIGPVCLNFIYRNWHLFGRGTMFVVGAALYGLGAMAVSCIPPKHANEEDDEEIDELLG